MFKVQTAVFCALTLTANLAAEEVIGGPYAVNVTSRSATIAWVVKTGDVKVNVSGKETLSVPVLRCDRISLAGLKPGQVVQYDALNGKSEGKGSFKTPAAPGATFDFVVFGDTRTRHELHRKITGAIEKLSLDFVIHTGDLVTDGYDAAQWPVFFDIERNLLKKVAFYPVLGNHERNSRQFYDFFNVTTPYYSFDWGSAHFALLNSDIGNVAISTAAKDAFWNEQLRWLDEDLAKAQKAEFRFVVMHHPPMTAVKRRQGEDKAVAQTMPIFEKHKVQAVFCGHDHNYQRHIKNGVTYIITGGGGAPLYPVDAPIPGVTQKVESTEHYVKVRVAPGKTSIHAVALDGHTIEEVELKP